MNPELPPNSRAELESRLTALLLGELPAEEAAALRQTIAADPALAALHQRLSLTLELVRETAATSAGTLSEQPTPLKLSPARREALLAHFKTVRPSELAQPKAKSRRISWLVPLAAAAAIVLLCGQLLFPRLAGRAQRISATAMKANRNGLLAGQYDSPLASEIPKPNLEESLSANVLSLSAAPARASSTPAPASAIRKLSEGNQGKPAPAREYATANWTGYTSMAGNLGTYSPQVAKEASARTAADHTIADANSLENPLVANTTEIQEGKRLYEKGEYAAAETKFQDSVNSDPSNPTFRYYLDATREARLEDAPRESGNKKELLDVEKESLVPSQNNLASGASSFRSSAPIHKAEIYTPSVEAENFQNSGNFSVASTASTDSKNPPDHPALNQPEVFLLTYADSKAVAQEMKDVFAKPDNQTASQRENPYGIFGGSRRLGGRGGDGADEDNRQPTGGLVNAVSDDQNNAVIINAAPDMIPGISNLIAKLDIPQDDKVQIKVLPLQHANAKDVASELDSMFPNPNEPASQGNAGGRGAMARFGGEAGVTGATANTLSDRMKRELTVNAVPDERTQSVLVTASRDTMPEVEKMVDNMDENPAREMHTYVYRPITSDVTEMQGPLQDIFGSSTSRSNTTQPSALTQRQSTAAQNAGTLSSSSLNGGTGFGGRGGGGGGGVGAGLGSSTSAGYAPNGQIGPITMTIDPVSGSIIYTTDEVNNTNVLAALKGLDTPRPQISDGRAPVLHSFSEGGSLPRSLETSGANTSLPTSGFTAGLTPEENTKSWPVAPASRGFYDDNSLTVPDGAGNRTSYGIDINHGSAPDGQGTLVAGVRSGTAGALGNERTIQITNGYTRDFNGGQNAAEVPTLAQPFANLALAEASAPSAPAILSRMRAARPAGSPAVPAASTVSGTGNLDSFDRIEMPRSEDGRRSPTAAPAATASPVAGKLALPALAPAQSYAGGTVVNNGTLGIQAGTAPSYTGAPTVANSAGIFPGGTANPIAQPTTGDTFFREIADAKSDREPATASAEDKMLLRAEAEGRQDVGIQGGLSHKLNYDQIVGFSNQFGVAGQGVAPFTSFPGNPGTNAFIANNSWAASDAYVDPDSSLSENSLSENLAANLDTKFASVTQPDTKGLAFNWFLGNTVLNNGSVGLQAGPPPAGTQPANSLDDISMSLVSSAGTIVLPTGAAATAAANENADVDMYVSQANQAASTGTNSVYLAEPGYTGVLTRPDSNVQVDFATGNASGPDLHTKTFHVDPAKFAESLGEINSQVLTGTGGEIGRGGGGIGGGGQTGAVSYPVVNAAPGAANTGGLASVTALQNTTNASAAVRKYFSSLGVNVTNNGAFVFDNDKSGELLVRADAKDMETISQAIELLKATPAAPTTSTKSTKSSAQPSSLITHNSSFPKAATNSPIPQAEVQTATNAFSTFSLNVSDVSFKLAEASLQKGALPDPATVRSEEFINAFDYRDLEPAPGAPIGFAWDRADYPFAHNRDLLRFSVKTAAAGRDTGRPLNLVILLDKSGSMERADRVAIIHEALRVLAGQLQPRDTVSVVLFARTARLWADGISGAKVAALANDLDAVTPEGGTNLEDAMKLAYETALRHYLANGENRVVILTDGAANLGDVKPEDLQQKAAAERTQGIALDCFGVGWEDYNDNLLEVLSRSGGGRYGFINAPEEAATEFAGQLAGALRVAASDVKVQVEFNPARVTSYRQIGYAKDQLTKEQFRDNTVKAAQLGVKESGNALYTVEINPQGSGPICTVHVRYRTPGTSDYYEHAWDVPYTGPSPSLDQAGPAIRLAASASAFSEWLAGSPYAGEVTPDQLLGYMRGLGELYGADHRPAELAQMLREAKSISGQ